MKKATKTTVKKATKKVVAKKAVAKKAVKKTAAKKVAAPVKKTPVKKVAAKKTAVKAVKKKTTVKKKVAKKAAPVPSKTTISASIDVGFGNSLFLRGEGPGLSWEKGIPLDCKSDSVWEISMTGVSESFDFKLLINDEIWDTGDNATAKPGIVNTTTPSF
ncbi:hypothetical protein MLD52_00295 [Puniceicoccaceae bacterium K14]|nr:hypothetical protein [Puniceicoccaceae bacterium K14]